MVDRQVGGNPPRPGDEVSIRPKRVARPVDPPEGLHSQIFCNARIAYDSHDPGIDIPLELSDHCFKRIDLAKRKSSQQIHVLLYYPLRAWKGRVTSFFEASPKAWKDRERQTR